jgi:hypothetical protein
MSKPLILGNHCKPSQTTANGSPKTAPNTYPKTKDARIAKAWAELALIDDNKRASLLKARGLR